MRRARLFIPAPAQNVAVNLVPWLRRLNIRRRPHYRADAGKLHSGCQEGNRRAPIIALLGGHARGSVIVRGIKPHKFSVHQEQASFALLVFPTHFPRSQKLRPPRFPPHLGPILPTCTTKSSPHTC